MEMKYGTVLINLEKSGEELWNEADKQNRWSVNKAKKDGITVKEGGDHEKCYSIYTKMCRRNYLIPLSNEKLFSWGKLFTAMKGEITVAFSIIEEKHPVAVLAANASDYEYRNTQANSLLYWETILHCKKNNFKTMDLGGVDLHSEFNKGIDSFKIKWGGQLVKKSKKTSLPNYLWWRYLRHNSSIRKLKYFVQTKVLGIKTIN